VLYDYYANFSTDNSDAVHKYFILACASGCILLQAANKLIRNQLVVGSSPTFGSTLFCSTQASPSSLQPVRRFRLRSGVISAFPSGFAQNIPPDLDNEPNQVPVIHLFFVAAVVPVCLSTQTLVIISARAVSP
jgi:hypothetical protein